jgi:hypothetical protein
MRGGRCGVARVWAAWGLIVRLSLAGILRWFAREHLSEVLSYPCLEVEGRDGFQVIQLLFLDSEGFIISVNPFFGEFI